MTNNIFEKMAQVTQGAMQRIHVKSALNPMLWLSAISMTLCFGAAYLFWADEFLRRLLVVFGCFVPLITCLIAIYFAVNKTDKLQSEDYQLRHESLQILIEKGGNIKIDQASIDSIATYRAELASSSKSKGEIAEEI
jgi:hypothetical protein